MSSEIPNKAYIYKITNTINGKLYIGETKEKNPFNRWKRHLYTIRKGEGCCPLLKAAFDKYGEKNFTFEIIHECFQDERYKCEQQKILEYNSLVPNGYNATLGGLGGGFRGKKHSDETKKKMSKSLSDSYKLKSENEKEAFRQKLHNRNYETFRTKEFREKMRNLTLGKNLIRKPRILKKQITSKTLKEETRLKISESVKRSYENGRSKLFSEERKNNLSEAMTKVRGVKISQYSLDGTFIKSYSSIKAANTELGIKSISKALSGKNKTAGGFIWKRISSDVSDETPL